MMGLTVKDIDKVIINLFHMITKVKEKYEHDEERGEIRYGKDKNGTSKVEK